MIRRLALLCLVGMAAAPGAWAESDAIRVQVSPGVHLLRPLKDSARITVEVGQGPARPAGPVDLSLRLTAPPPGTLVSTDFPLIEGTPLIHMELSGVPGTLSWDYVFPIRGVYRLDVAAADGTGRRWQRTVELELREDPARVALLAGFAAALFLLGFVAGRVFSSPAGGVGMLVAVLLMGSGAGAAPQPSGAGAPDGTLAVTPARVGALSTIRWRGADRGTGEPVPAQVTLRVAQLEKGREVFRLNRLPTGGELTLSFQFTDASPHQVTATAFPRGREPAVETSATVHVASDVASFSTRVRPVLLFLLVVLAGLVAGRVSKRRGFRLRWNAGRG